MTVDNPVTEFLLYLALIKQKIITSFMCMSYIIIPILIVIIILFVLLIKSKKNVYIEEKTNKAKKYKIAIIILLIVEILCLVIGSFFSDKYIEKKNKDIEEKARKAIINQEDSVEKELEKKYNKNFTFVSKDKFGKDEYAGYGLYEYYMNYVFKDDDGVYAPVTLKVGTGWDYYESKRSKYDIEQAIYKYAKTVNFNEDFYIFVESQSESINESNLKDKPRENFIASERKYNRIVFVLKNKSENNRKFIIDALDKIENSNDYIINEYVVEENEYDGVVSYYKEFNNNPGIEGKDYEVKDYFLDNSIVIHEDYYYYSWGYGREVGD